MHGLGGLHADGSVLGYFTTGASWARIWQVMLIWAPDGLVCCPSLGSGSVVVNSLFAIAPIDCGNFVFSPSFAVQY